MNTSFTAYAPLTGEVLYSGTASDIAILATDGVAILAGEKFEGGWLDNGIHFEQPVKPSNHHIFNWVTKQWHDPRTLQDLKDAQWNQIKQARASAIASPLVTPYGTFDADANSRTAITDSVLLLQTLSKRGKSTTIAFTLSNNTNVVLDMNQIEDVGMLLGDKTNQAFARGRVLREQIMAATDPAALALIVW